MELHLQQLRNALLSNMFVAPVGTYIIICDMELECFNGLLIVSLPIKKFYGKVSNLKDTKLSD